MVRGCSAGDEMHAGIGAGLDHPVGLFERVRYRLLDRYGSGAAFDGHARQVGAPLDVGGDCDNVKRLIAQHLPGIGVESVNAVSFAECLKSLFVAFSACRQLDAGAVVEDLRPRVGYIRSADVLVIVELAVNVESRRRAFDVVDRVRPAFVDHGYIGQHAHPAEADDAGAIFLCRAILP